MQCKKCLSEWKSTVNTQLKHCPFCQATLSDGNSNLSDFVIEDGVLTKYLGNDKIVTIPDTVHTIGKRCFFNNNCIAEITIPNSVVEIDDYAFCFSNKLVKIHMSNSLVKIGESGISGCLLLESITLPDTLVEIGKYAFLDSPKLQEINIPKSVTKIGEGAFQVCENLTVVGIPTSISVINKKMFSACKKLSKVCIPKWVTEIQSIAFKECKSLKTVILYSNVKLAEDAFLHCSALKEVIIIDADNEENYTIYNMRSELELIANLGVCKAKLNYRFSDELKEQRRIFNEGLAAAYGTSNINEIASIMSQQKKLEKETLKNEDEEQDEDEV